ncbi:MAG: ankryin [Zetaproteobacteria bacterium CG12_big_fil_rev_8_21_14_0_65_54_13]|nr:MAG: ankryin [Zetaproteobacteria bacterium CG23_combo_of_CG06-09_8_20_14_all_54_7]PIW50714.1 MAG: ankryin [Zetaproteobacteria bacterium CG12_big_fil_rev_8_21_14_0_65_54_13]PIX55595.1 MAG: ankryin [Zetaproteobacteria bacterium CG_4_10_14_3_um_filter_54_28]PJA27467.1 MAG: ankryin [Zetaproteobacteria bacterium CG_4_9_14_3_um_filter_54_145]
MSDSTWFHAAGNGDSDALKQALDAGMDINATNALGNTALHEATGKAQLACMALLIGHGAALNAANNNAATPLHLAEKNIDAIRILLEAGADPNLRDSDWNYPYYYAFYGSMSRELIDLYIRHGARLVYNSK